MQIVLLGMLMFTLVVISLVVLLMVAKAQLVNTGDVTLNINESKDLTVPAGTGHPFVLEVVPSGPAKGITDVARVTVTSLAAQTFEIGDRG